MSTSAPTTRVLPTLNEDGTRRWVRPRSVTGRYYRARRVVAWCLMALFAVIPLIKVNGRPLILLDVQHREFSLFGRVFLPTDGELLMLLLLATFMAIIGLTALFGRVWCGWGCPQTVYMEFVFRPIERFFDGASRHKSRKAPLSATRWALKYATFAVVAFVLGNLFLSYFVGVDRLVHWMSASPLIHPTGFAVMTATAGLVFIDFAYFREQMCTVVCPYARLQSVLLDAKSLVVAYDGRRGEPRGKKGRTTGDCVDCKACVAVCPTGIDIREGLQLECIACTQCIDACDGIMDKLKRPRGLIRYTSEDALAKGRLDKRALLRARTIAYPALFVVLVGVLWAVSGQSAVADVTVLRGIGAPFVEQGDKVQNLIRVKIRNRTSEERSFHVSIVGARDIDLLAPEDPLTLSPRAQGTETVFMLAPRASFTRGARSIRIQISDNAGYSYTTSYKLVGPEPRR